MSVDEGRRALLTEEITALRGELNATIDRMNGNENFSAGAVSAIFAFILSKPLAGMNIVLALLSVGVGLFGFARYLELRTHARQLDAYLRRSEQELDPRGGWSTHFSQNIMSRNRLSFSATRYVFWAGVICLALFGVVASLIEGGS